MLSSETVEKQKRHRCVEPLGFSHLVPLPCYNMANVVDQDQQWLLGCLSATLDPNQEVRCFAEASLDQASRQPGFVFCVNCLVLEPKIFGSFAP